MRLSYNQTRHEDVSILEALSVTLEFLMVRFSLAVYVRSKSSLICWLGFFLYSAFKAEVVFNIRALCHAANVTTATPSRTVWMENFWSLATLLLRNVTLRQNVTQWIERHRHPYRSGSTRWCRQRACAVTVSCRHRADGTNSPETRRTQIGYQGPIMHPAVTWSKGQRRIQWQ
jgi:hypothetical protein